MNPEHTRERTGPSDEVGSEGGSPGDLDVDKQPRVSIGREGAQNVIPVDDDIEEHDHQLERDGRPRP